MHPLSVTMPYLKARYLKVTMTRTTLTALAVIVLAVPFVGQAQETEASATDIQGFTISTISSTDLNLASQFGTRTGDTHVVSKADCYSYLGLGDLQGCSAAEATDTTDTGDTGDTGDTTDTGDDTTNTGETGDTTDTTDTTGTDDTTDTGDDTTDTGDDTELPADDTSCVGVPDGELVCVNDVEYECTGQKAASPETCDEYECGTLCNVDCGFCDTGECILSDNGAGNCVAQKPGGKADHGGAAGDHVFTIEVSMDDKHSDGLAYEEFGVAIGESCDASTWPTTDTDGQCRRVTTDLYTPENYSSISVDVKVGDLLPDACTGSGGDITVYFYVTTKSGDTTTTYVVKEVFDRDYTAPTAPTGVTVTGGDTNLKVDWTAGSETESDVTYKVYYSTSTFSSDALPSGVETVSTTSGQITGLSNEQTYYVGVVAVDDAGNETTLCTADDIKSGSPLEVDDFFEYYKRQGGQEQGGFGCAYGPTSQGGAAVVLLLLLTALMLRNRAWGRQS